MKPIQKRARVVVEFVGDSARQEAEYKMDDIQQVCMCRNPLDEPNIHVEVSEDGGATWEYLR